MIWVLSAQFVAHAYSEVSCIEPWRHRRTHERKVSTGSQARTLPGSRWYDLLQTHPRTDIVTEEHSLGCARLKVNFERYISEKYPPSVRRGCNFKSSWTCLAFSMINARWLKLCCRGQILSLTPSILKKCGGSQAICLGYLG